MLDESIQHLCHFKDVGSIFFFFFFFFKRKILLANSVDPDQLPHQWGDSDEHTQYTIFNTKEKQKNTSTLNYPKSAAMGFFQRTQERVRNSHSKRAISEFYCIYIVLSPKLCSPVIAIDHLKLRLNKNRKWKKNPVIQL